MTIFTKRSCATSTVHISNGGAFRLSKGSNSIVISALWDNDSLRTPATTHMRNVGNYLKKKMRAWILIILCTVCAFLIYEAILTFATDSTETRYLEYKDCRISYFYSSSDFFFSNYRTKGHSLHNWTELAYAKHELIKCLCEKYVQEPDSDLKIKILDYYKEDESFKVNYSLIKYYFIPPIDTILKYGQRIFRTDTCLFNQFIKYKITNDPKIGFLLYEKYKEDSSLFLNDFGILNYVHERIDIPTIDSICKYKEKIFGTFYRVPE